MRKNLADEGKDQYIKWFALSLVQLFLVFQFEFFIVDGSLEDFVVFLACKYVCFVLCVLFAVQFALNCMPFQNLFDKTVRDRVVDKQTVDEIDFASAVQESAGFENMDDSFPAGVTYIELEALSSDF